MGAVQQRGMCLASFMVYKTGIAYIKEVGNKARESVLEYFIG